VATIEAERDALEKKSQAENALWSTEREKLESAPTNPTNKTVTAITLNHFR
jgi:hypothetical protein